MRKLTFPEINDLVVKHKNGSFFSKDLELFKKQFPAHALNNDLARANQFSFEGLDGQMLSVLLEVVPIDTILENRKADDQKIETPIVITLDEIRSILSLKTDLPQATIDSLGDEALEPLKALTEEEIIQKTKEGIEKTRLGVAAILKKTFGYTDEMINDLPSEYISELMDKSEVDIIEKEKSRINNSKPGTIEAVKELLVSEFTLTKEAAEAIPEETLNFFAQRSRSEIVVGYKHLIDKELETNIIEKENLVDDVKVLKIEKETLVDDIEELESAREDLEETIENLQVTKKEVIASTKKKGTNKKSSKK